MNIHFHYSMEYTTLPSSRGQITLSAKLREKYKITKDTPIVVEDKGNGKIELRVLKTRDYNDDDAIYYEDEGGFGVHFPKGIDPQVILDYLRKKD